MDRTLILMRHATTEDRHPQGDQQRRLTPHGESQARAAGAWLVEHGWAPHLALVSSAVRTQQTMDGVVAGGVECEVWPEPRLYNASSSTVLSIIEESPASAPCTLVLAHAPGIPDTAHRLYDHIVEPPSQVPDFVGWPPATLAVYQVQNSSDGIPVEAVQLLAYQEFP